MILAAIGDRDAAIRLLQQATVSGRDRSGMHFSLELRSLRGHPAFEAFIAPER